MLRNLSVLALAALVVALPFLLRRADDTGDWRSGDPVLTIISPHNEAIRHEFALAFSDWHRERFGRPVKIEWRIIGGTSEIIRYLEGEYIAAFQAWWRASGRDWPAGGGDYILDRRFNPAAPPEDAAELPAWEIKRDLYQSFRAHDSNELFGSGIDLFFGGGSYDHGKLAGEGLSVKPWGERPPRGLFQTAAGEVLIPESLSGELWRSEHFFGNAASTFGICYNIDRLRDLGIAEPPDEWEDLADPRYIHQLGMADPTKSGSIAKAFEMIIHQQCALAVERAGFASAEVDSFESAIAAWRTEGLPPDVPPEYQTALEQGWLDGLRLVRRIAANARYFTDSAGKVPVDVGAGDAAAGLAIDFYGRYQSEFTRNEKGQERMFYVTPRGGSSVSADPISLLRGAPNRALAVRFIEFVLSRTGQRLWNSAPGSPGGPRKYALRRLPVRRDFYPSDNPDFEDFQREASRFSVDDLASPQINPYALADTFQYRPRWTAALFSLHRDLIRSSCLDSGEELRAAWAAIVRAGGPQACPAAMAELERMPDVPVPLDWKSAHTVIREHGRLETMRAWTIFFRDQYRRARALAEEGGK
jgi:iron(III) transport system substrate-binding protein